jgi:predicted O-linked N-acetylglucosamine transferase (SPINDLY family)
MAEAVDELEQGLRWQREGELARARDHYCAVLRRQPGHARAWHLLGVAAYEAGDARAAVECLERAWAGNRTSAAFHADLGRAHRAAGSRNEALASFREATRLRPEDPDLHVELGQTYLQAHLTADALNCVQEALRLDPDRVTALLLASRVLLTRGEWAEAESHCRRAIRLQGNVSELHDNLGVALSQQGRLEEAEACHRQALGLDPENAQAWNHRGIVFQTLGQVEPALACYQEALRRWPDRAPALNNVGGALLLLNRVVEATPYLEQAVRLEPNRAEMLVNLGTALVFQGRVEEGTGCMRRASRLPGMAAPTHSDVLFALNFDPSREASGLFEDHVRWGKIHGQGPGAAPHGNAPDPDRVLRVGYVSPDFHWHAVNRFFEPVLANHDPAQVQAFCYAEVLAPDAVTRRLQGMARGWYSTCGRSDAEVAERIRADGIDVLVDLAGHTAGSRVQVLAQRPAPVQAAYLGYPNTTGLAAVAYRLTDAAADPPGGPRLYTEELVYLDGPFCCFQPPPDAPAVGPLPAAGDGVVTFGSPHNLGKLNGRVLDLWARVLHAVPRSRLLLFRHNLLGSAQERLAGEFGRRGIDAGRLEFKEIDIIALGDRGYLELYNGVDVCLDAFPVSAHTTACEALLMGVPLLTLSGDRTWGRLTASVLTWLGLRDWVAATPDDYVALAARHCADLGGLAGLRAGLRGRLLARLGDGPGFTRRLEAAYRALWRRWCQGAAPTRSPAGRG